MTRSKFPFLLVLLVGATLFSFRMIMVSEWTVDLENVNISVTGKSVNATMNGLDAEIKFSPADLMNSKVTASIQTSSLAFKSKLQTKHAHSDNWMDVEKYPTVSFTSREIQKTDAGFEAVGELDLHGVRKEITLPFTFMENEKGGVFKGEIILQRFDYGIGGKGGPAQEITVGIEVPVS